MDTPILVCDRDIAPVDEWAEAFGESQPVFSSTTIKNFLDQHPAATEMILEVRTDGGSTSEARICYDMLRNSGKKIITHGYKCNSSGMVLFLAGDERLISENSDSIIHPVWVDAFGLPWQLEAQDLRLFADEIDKEQGNLLDIYCSVIGEDKREEVSGLMSATTNLSADESIRLGFATGKLEGVKSENSKRSVAYTNKMLQVAMMNKKKSNQEEMSNEIKELNKKFDGVMNFINKFVSKNETQNASAELSEGGSVYYDGELTEGVAVFTDEGMESPAPDGEHLLADGRTIVVSEGMVSEVKAAVEEPENSESEEVKALNEKVEALETTNATILENQKKFEEKQAKQLEALNKVNELLSAMKNLVPADGDFQNKKNVEKKDPSKMTNLEKKRAKQAKL